MDKNLYDLTSPQKNILSIEKYYNNTSINTNCGVAEINQKVDFKKLSEAVTLLIKNNSIFRLKFDQTDTVMRQYFDESFSYSPKIFEITNKKDLVELKKTYSHKALFNAKHLFEFAIYRLPNEHGGIIGSVHHLLSDSWGVGLMFDEILRIYSLLLSNSYEDVESNYNYTDFIDKEQEYFKSAAFEKDKAFWDEMFQTLPSQAALPTTQPLVKQDISCSADRVLRNIDHNIVIKINEFCKNNKISVYHFLMAIFSIYIGSIANTDDFVIGTPILNRLNFADKHTMGMFVSTVPFRINLNQNISFCEFSQNISQKILSILRHQRYPYENLLQDLRKSNSSLPNLYNFILSYQITKLSNCGLDCTSSWEFNGTCADDFQIHIVDYDNNGSLDILYDYKTDKYSQIDIINMHTRIFNMIRQVLENENLLIHDIEIVTDKEKEQIISDFNNTEVNYPKDKTITEIIEEQVSKTPDKIALVFEDKELTYKELNEKANSLAFYLRSKGIRPR